MVSEANRDKREASVAWTSEAPSGNKTFRREAPLASLRAKRSNPETGTTLYNATVKAEIYNGSRQHPMRPLPQPLSRKRARGGRRLGWNEVESQQQTSSSSSSKNKNAGITLRFIPAYTRYGSSGLDLKCTAAGFFWGASGSSTLLGLAATAVSVLSKALAWFLGIMGLTSWLGATALPAPTECFSGGQGG